MESLGISSHAWGEAARYQAQGYNVSLIAHHGQVKTSPLSSSWISKLFGAGGTRTYNGDTILLTGDEKAQTSKAYNAETLKSAVTLTVLPGAALLGGVLIGDLMSQNWYQQRLTPSYGQMYGYL